MTRRDAEQIRAKFDDHVGQIIKQFQTLPPGDVWEAFARDIQYGESSVYEEYERLMDNFCTNLFQAITNSNYCGTDRMTGWNTMKISRTSGLSGRRVCARSFVGRYGRRRRT